MADDRRFLRAALERGWISREQAESGRTAAELLSAGQLRELETGRDLASRVLEAGLLKGGDLVESAPSRFGRYEILREIGQGGGGRVYLARDPELGREVAVKILDRGAFAQPERFRREREILAALRHPNIVAIFDAGAHDGRPYFAMEYASGRSLAEAKLPLADAVRVLEQVALACHAAHEKGVVHRDLKPANILLADRPLVADFGIAKTAGAELTETGQTLGTPHYMSPEQAEGREVDTRTDVYSLGVMLYEALAGRRPFLGTAVLEIARQVVHDEPPRPRALNPAAPRDLELVALRAMAKRPGDRYPTAEAFARDLAAWREGRPVSARPPGLRERAASLARRHPRKALVFAGALLALLAVGLFSGSGRRLERAQQVVLQEALAIERWQVNLYKPAKEIEYRDLEGALGRLSPVLSWPELTPVLRRQGHAAAARAYLYMGRTPEALAALDRAVEAGSGQRNGEDLFERARLRWEDLLREALSKNEPESARLKKHVEADLRAALAAGFLDEWARDFAAALLRLAEQGERAVEPTLADLARLAAARGKPAEEVTKLRGDLFLLLKRPEEAVAEYRRAIAARPSYVQAHNGLALGLALRKHGEDREMVLEAFTAASQAIDLNPRYEASYFLFAWLCRDSLRSSPREFAKADPAVLALVEEAVAKLRQGRRVRPDSTAIAIAHGMAGTVRALLVAGLGRDASGAVDEAEQALEAAIALDGNRAEPWLALGAAQSLRRDRSRAERSLAEALRRAPRNAVVHRWLGHLHFAAARWKDAAAAWRRAVELDPSLGGEIELDIVDAERRK
jgi:tetratricopeptide (TPR) repeat protein/predicted Ser/Thr protein kinase